MNRRDQREPQQRIQQLRSILRTMERAVVDAKSRRTAGSEPRLTTASPIAGSVSPGRPAGAAGHGRDIPGPDSLPRAKAKPKFLDGLRTPFGRTG